jgi:hypothetical protein
MISEALILTTGQYAQWMDYLTADLVQDLETADITVEQKDLSQLSQGEISILLDDLALDRPERLLISFNGRISLPDQGRDGQPYKIGCWHFHWIVDSPAHYYTALMKLPENTIVGVVDPSHIKMMGCLGLGHKTIYFPHRPDRSIQINPEYCELGQRFLFAGNIPFVPDKAVMLEQNAKEVAPFIQAVWRAADHQARYSCATYDALEAECQKVGTTLDLIPAAMLSGLLLLLEKLSGVLARMRVLDLLSDDFDIDVIGDKTDHPLWNKPNLHPTGKMSFDEVRARMNRAQAVINITPKFPSGVTERIWQTLEQGGVLLSNSAKDIRDEIESGLIKGMDLSLDDACLKQYFLDNLGRDQLLACRDRLSERGELPLKESRLKKLLSYVSQLS